MTSTDYCSDYGLVLKYMSDGEALRRTIAKEPRETVPSGAYADWLEENGEGELAAVIRKHSEHFQKGPETHERRSGKLTQDEVDRDRFIVQFPTNHSVALWSPKNDKGTDHHFHWYGRHFAPEEMKSLKGLISKGHRIEPTPHLHQLLNELDYQDCAGHRGHIGQADPSRDNRTLNAKRLMTADVLREQGREEEADLMESHHPIDAVDTGAPELGDRRWEVHADYSNNAGGYPVFYAPHGDALCPECMNDAVYSYPFDFTQHHTREHVHWEGPPEHCQNCPAQIESTYGDPHADHNHEE